MIERQFEITLSDSLLVLREMRVDYIELVAVD